MPAMNARLGARTQSEPPFSFAAAPNPPRGTEPAGEADAPLRSGALGKTPRARSDTTVLLIEDDAIVAEIYRLSLTRAGFKVLVASNGELGMQRATESIPDFIFLDIRMPKMDGVEVLRHLASLDATRGIPVVMMSNFDDRALIESSRALGAKEYLVKVNTDPTQLAVIVDRWLSAAG